MPRAAGRGSRRRADRGSCPDRRSGSPRAPCRRSRAPARCAGAARRPAAPRTTSPPAPPRPRPPRRVVRAPTRSRSAAGIGRIVGAGRRPTPRIAAVRRAAGTTRARRRGRGAPPRPRRRSAGGCDIRHQIAVAVLAHAQATRPVDEVARAAAARDDHDAALELDDAAEVSRPHHHARLPRDHGHHARAAQRLGRLGAEHRLRRGLRQRRHEREPRSAARRSARCRAGVRGCAPRRAPPAPPRRAAVR